MKTTFKRYELKYLISKKQQKKLLELFLVHMIADEYGKSKICNIYYDTDNFLLIRRSIEKPIYKEKLRLRSYGVANNETMVFLELKKKFEHVVYKRRIVLGVDDASEYLKGNIVIENSQISKEINYFKNIYNSLKPKVYISYDRQAFFGKTNKDFRVTFDENILWRDMDLSLKSESYGNKILKDDMVLMEIKVSHAMPLWLTQFLSQNKIYKISFSKYGNAYKQIIKRKEDNENVA